MSLVRPEVAAVLVRWQEVILALIAVVFGLWVLQRGGLFYGALGGIILALGVGLAVSAWRRLRFRRPVEAAGVVEVVEGLVSYFGPEAGGQAALSELIRVEVHPWSTDRAWVLVQDDRSRLTIPVAASGAEALFDIFAALPGARTETFLAALNGKRPETPKILWQRAQVHMTTDFSRP